MRLNSRPSCQLRHPHPVMELQDTKLQGSFQMKGLKAPIRKIPQAGHWAKELQLLALSTCRGICHLIALNSKSEGLIALNFNGTTRINGPALLLALISRILVSVHLVFPLTLGRLVVIDERVTKGSLRLCILLQLGICRMRMETILPLCCPHCLSSSLARGDLIWVCLKETSGNG